MTAISTGLLIWLLVLMLLLSVFFSAAETAMMSVNRYRVRHLEKSGSAVARRVSRLLQRTDRLLGVVLLGNTFSNILASSIATMLALRYGDEVWVAVVAFVLGMVMLIFAEVAPKTVAARYPERVAFSAARLLELCLWLFYPLVWLINVAANGMLRLLGMARDHDPLQQLSSDELRIVVNEASGLIPKRHQRMLVNILDLEKATVEDIMVPRNEVTGIDLGDDLEDIQEQLKNAQYTRLPLYYDDIDQTVGMLHMRDVVVLLSREHWGKDELRAIAEQPYFVPAGTPLNTQLLKFQRHKRRAGLVVDEYGDVEGLVTLEDILEEIVGEFTTDISESIRDIYPQPDGSFLVDGSVNIRVLNRMLGWRLPIDGPKTLSGLIIDHLEVIPESGISIKIGNYALEIVQVMDNMVKTVRVRVMAGAG
ncbi:MAG: HlyC/CorC family transporter [Gammaproteobacteria bacterium]|nr:HlyC/CorC family transporter [Gammaproteobacteria bacterium]